MYASLQETTCLFFLNDPRSLQRLFYWPKGGGKRSTWLKKHHGFSCDNNSKKRFSSCCTAKATCC